MNAKVSLRRFHRLSVSRALRAAAGFKPKQPLRAVAMPGKIVIEPVSSSGHLVRRKGRLVWTGELPEGTNSAGAVNAARNCVDSIAQKLVGQSCRFALISASASGAMLTQSR